MSIDFKNKKFLVVDDFSEFRRLMRRMLESLGVRDIDDASGGEIAIQKMKTKAYDIILCDYNLGYGKKDGQQILEEAKHRGLVRYSTVFIMLTAENTMPMVMGAVEYQPDDYLIKPITKEILTLRLEKNIRRKEDSEVIERAIRKNEYTRAIALCDELILKNPKNRLEYLRVKSDLYLSTGRYSEATAVFEEVLSMRDILWARMGLGKVYFLSGEHVRAKEIFQSLVEENKTLMEAYDWLAKTLEAMGSLEEAQKVLISATEISPKAILRHQAIGKISYRIEDYDTAGQAFKSAISIGKHSCFKSPSDYTGLAKTLVNKDSSGEALSVLGEARKEFKGDSDAMLQTAVTEGLVFKKMNREEDARNAVQEASKLMDGYSGSIPLEATMDLAKVCFDLGEKEAGLKFIQNVMRNNHDNDKVVKMVRDVFKEANLEKEGEDLIIAAKTELLKLNNKGVGLAEEGKLEEAIEYFEKAVRVFPDNKIVNANAAQVLIMHIKKNGRNDKHLYKVSQYLDRIRKIDPSYDRYKELLDVYEKLMTAGAKPQA
ncbi:MAG: tetratricopeptide repeat protein [Nitrospirae bacterium]|nr:tetratricopeptide repeat protein [Nitrospirota bacterium]